MAKRFLPTPQTFADGSYPVTADAWSNKLRALALSSSDKSAGFTPKTPNAARVSNGLWREYHDAEAVAAHAAIQRWGVKTLNPTDASYLVAAVSPIRITDKQQYYVLAAGTVTSGGHAFFDIHKTIAADWAKYQAKHNASAVTVTPVQIAAAKNGIYFLRAAGSDTFYFGDLSTSTLSADTTFTGSGQTIGLVGFVGTATTGNGILSLSDGNLYYDATGSWVVATSPVSVTSPYEFVQNTDGSIVVFSCKVGTTPKLLASFDQGVTWTLGHTFAPTAQPGSLCFWEKLGLFVYLEDSTGTLFTSSNGLAWTAAETGAPQSITSGGGVDRNAFQLASGTGHAMAACGPFLARLLQRADTLGNASQGVAYTADLLNWNYAALADSSYGNLADLYSLDGRLVAFFRGTGGVFGAGDSAPTSALLTSDLLEAPAVDFP